MFVVSIKSMKLLIITQSVDIEDTTLGFFTRWVEEFSKRFDSVEVICLYEGKHAISGNVKVHSLGKENGNSRIQYVRKFFTYIWNYRNEYDAVFVHMNQEYIVLAGWLWVLLGKKIFFWRNHPYGNIWTRIAVFFSDRVFCTADASFTARYQKTVRMPAGIDTTLFSVDTHAQKTPHSLLLFGRIAPVKRIEKAIDTVAFLLAKGVPVHLSIVGDALPRDSHYVQWLKERITTARIEPHITFVRGVDFLSAPKTYQNHEIFLNFTDSGSFDKTVIEALACGTKVLVSNTSMKDLVPDGSYTTGEQNDIVDKIMGLYALRGDDLTHYHAHALRIVEQQSLSRLMDLLYSYVVKN